MDNVKQIKCPKCGFLNMKGTRTCSKCHTNIDSYRKSCPKCGKINANNVKRCVSCKYNFMKKRKSIWFYLIISLIFMVVLFLLVYFCKDGFYKKFNLVLKVFSGFMILAILVNTLTYGSKDKINYTAEDEMLYDYKKFNGMKRFSSIAIIVGGILAIIYLIYYYIFR